MMDSAPADTLLEYSRLKKRVLGLRQSIGQFATDARQLAAAPETGLDDVGVSHSGQTFACRWPGTPASARAGVNMAPAQVVRDLQEFTEASAQLELVKERLREMGHGHILDGRWRRRPRHSHDRLALRKGTAMHSGRMTVAALAIAAMGFAFWTHGAAAEVSGSFRALMSVVYDYTTIDHAGAKVTGGSSTGTSTVFQSSGGVFAEGAAHLMTCVVYATISEADTDIRASCTFADASGDSWYARAKRSAGGVEAGSVGAGRWELLGGTGKYVGLSGQCPYDAQHLPGNRLVLTADCTWQK